MMKIAQTNEFIFTNDNESSFSLTSQTNEIVSTTNDTNDFLLMNLTNKSMTMNSDLDNSQSTSAQTSRMK